MPKTPVIKISSSGANEEIYPIVEQAQVDRLYKATVALAEAEIYLPGETCFVAETKLHYYYDQNSSATRNGITVLNTGGAGRLLIMPTGSHGSYLTKSANYTILNTDPRTLDGDTDSGPFTFTLTSAPIDGIFREIKNIGGSGNDLSVVRNGKTIDGRSEDLILRDKDSITLQYTVNGWQIR